MDEDRADRDEDGEGSDAESEVEDEEGFDARLEDDLAVSFFDLTLLPAGQEKSLIRSVFGFSEP